MQVQVTNTMVGNATTYTNNKKQQLRGMEDKTLKNVFLMTREARDQTQIKHSSEVSFGEDHDDQQQEQREYHSTSEF